MGTSRTVVVALTTVILIGWGMSVFAHSGMGWGSGRGHHGPEWHHGGGYDAGYDSQLSKEENKQLEKNEKLF